MMNYQRSATLKGLSAMRLGAVVALCLCGGFASHLRMPAASFLRSSSVG